MLCHLSEVVAMIRIKGLEMSLALFHVLYGASRATQQQVGHCSLVDRGSITVT